MAVAGDAERLVVLLEARVDQFEKRMKRASGTATRSYSKMRRGSNTATRQMERDMTRSTGRINQALATTTSKIGLLGKTMVAGLLAGGIAGTVSQIGRIARGIAEIGDEAKRAGLNIQTFQELKFVAERNRIGVDSLVDGIKELNLRADEFITTGGGAAAEAFVRIGYDAETLAGKLENPSALFTEIIGKLEGLDRAAQIRIADEIFGGTGGEKFVQLIEQGEQGIRDTIEAAYDLGAVLDEETIAKADELDKQFQNIVVTVGSGLKQAIVNASFALLDFFNILRSVNNQSTENLEALLKSAREIRTAYGIEGSEAYLASLEREGEIMTELESRAKQVLRTGLLALPGNEPSVPLGNGGGRGTSQTSSIKQQRDAAAELIGELENELLLMGESQLEQRINVELRKAGAEASDKQKSAIVNLVTNIEAEAAAIEKLEAALESAKGLTKDFFSGLLGDLRNGVEGTKALSNAFGRLGDRLIDMALDQAINALFSNLMGAFTGNAIPGVPINLLSGIGMNAAGTDNWRGGLTSINERGGEIVNLPGGTQIIPHDISMQMAANSFGSPNSNTISAPSNQTFNFNWTINGATSDETIQEIRALEARIPYTIKRVLRDPGNMSAA